MLICIAIVAVDGPTVARIDPSLSSQLGAQIKRPTSTHHHPPDVSTCSHSFGDDRPHQIARLKAEIHLLALPMPSGETAFVGSADLPVAMPGRTDEERYHPLCKKTRW